MEDDDKSVVLSAMLLAFMKLSGVRSDSLEHDLDAFSFHTGYPREKLRPILKPVYDKL